MSQTNAIPQFILSKRWTGWDNFLNYIGGPCPNRGQKDLGEGVSPMEDTMI